MVVARGKSCSLATLVDFMSGGIGLGDALSGVEGTITTGGAAIAVLRWHPAPAKTNAIRVDASPTVLYHTQWWREFVIQAAFTFVASKSFVLP
jgi:hypothetical protein